MKNRRGEIATLLTLGLVLVGAVATIATSIFTNNQKSLASNPRAAFSCSVGTPVSGTSSQICSDLCAGAGGSYVSGSQSVEGTKRNCCCNISGAAPAASTFTCSTGSPKSDSSTKSCATICGTGTYVSGSQKVEGSTRNCCCTGASATDTTAFSCTTGTAKSGSYSKTCPTICAPGTYVSNSQKVDGTTRNCCCQAAPATPVAGSEGGACKVGGTGNFYCDGDLTCNLQTHKCEKKSTSTKGCGSGGAYSCADPAVDTSACKTKYLEFNCCYQNGNRYGCIGTPCSMVGGSNPLVACSGVQPATDPGVGAGGGGQSGGGSIVGEGQSCCFTKKGLIYEYARYQAMIDSSMPLDCSRQSSMFISKLQALDPPGAFVCKTGSAGSPYDESDIIDTDAPKSGELGGPCKANYSTFTSSVVYECNSPYVCSEQSAKGVCVENDNPPAAQCSSTKMTCTRGTNKGKTYSFYKSKASECSDSADPDKCYGNSQSSCKSYSWLEMESTKCGYDDGGGNPGGGGGADQCYQTNVTCNSGMNKGKTQYFYKSKASECSDSQSSKNCYGATINNCKAMNWSGVMNSYCPVTGPALDPGASGCDAISCPAGKIGTYYTQKISNKWYFFKTSASCGNPSAGFTDPTKVINDRSVCVPSGSSTPVDVAPFTPLTFTPLCSKQICPTGSNGEFWKRKSKSGSYEYFESPANCNDANSTGTTYDAITKNFRVCAPVINLDLRSVSDLTATIDPNQQGVFNLQAPLDTTLRCVPLRSTDMATYTKLIDDMSRGAAASPCDVSHPNLSVSNSFNTSGLSLELSCCQ